MNHQQVLTSLILLSMMWVSATLSSSYYPCSEQCTSLQICLYYKSIIPRSGKCVDLSWLEDNNIKITMELTPANDPTEFIGSIENHAENTDVVYAVFNTNLKTYTSLYNMSFIEDQIFAPYYQSQYTVQPGVTWDFGFTSSDDLTYLSMRLAVLTLKNV
ncbi:hypothetical protein SAMD00019534_088740, partial [Acytostelium subglobosum LB1]|uniref:hypothetical protein n=1 Tax=Acytostelium subglobosum LB1 TaxID=1410327 RepID=UPI000644CE99